MFSTSPMPRAAQWGAGQGRRPTKTTCSPADGAHVQMRAPRIGSSPGRATCLMAGSWRPTEREVLHRRTQCGSHHPVTTRREVGPHAAGAWLPEPSRPHCRLHHRKRRYTRLDFEQTDLESSHRTTNDQKQRWHRTVQATCGRYQPSSWELAWWHVVQRC
eukprot:scaffold91036_cov27-Tisochrysis_lutea.AAC.7